MKRISQRVALFVLPLVSTLTAGAAHAQFLPNAPNAATNEARALKPGPGVFVVDTSIKVDATRAQTKNKKGEMVEAGWHPRRLEFTLWGKVDSSDVIVVTWKDGAKTVGTSECQAPEITDTLDRYQWLDQGQVNCLTDEKEKIIYPRAGTFDAEIAIKSTAKTTPLRKITFTVKAIPGSINGNKVSTFYVDHDYRMRENFAYWGDGGLFLRFWLKRDGDNPPPDTGKTSCTVDGAALGNLGPPTPSDVSPDNAGLEITLDPDADKKVHWQQMQGVVWGPREKFKSGKYDCQIIAKGKLLRTFRFEVEKTGRIAPSAEQQTGRAGAIASRSTYVSDVTYGDGADLAFDRSAVDRRSFMGRPWLEGAPSTPSTASGKSPTAKNKKKKK